MSTGAECYFTETAPGKWTYWLQDYPYGSNEDGQTYGPFPSFKAAFDHLDRNHANPGGHSSNCLPDGQHVHEWTVGYGQVKRGVSVQFNLLDLPSETTVAEVADLLNALGTTSITGMRVWPNYVSVDNVTRCLACGKQK